MTTEKTVSGTKEWAASNVNVMLGCKHGCLYCYARATARRFGRVAPGEWENEVVLPNLAAKSFGKRKGTIMFPTTHDITVENSPHTFTVLAKLLQAGNHVLVVSKPSLEVFEALCARFSPCKDQILFRFTIGSRDDAVLSAWEPGAPKFDERKSSLAYAWAHGFKTSVSMEPLLDVREDDIVAVVNDLTPFVTDAIWLGKMNKAEERLKRNGLWDTVEGVQERAKELTASQSDERIQALYERLRDHPKVKWKESIKKVVGIEIPTEAGQDV